MAKAKTLDPKARLQAAADATVFELRRFLSVDPTAEEQRELLSQIFLTMGLTGEKYEVERLKDGQLQISRPAK